MNICALFSTRERVMILNEVIYRSGPIGVNEVAREARLSKGLVSKYLNRLVGEGVLEKRGGKFFVEENVNVRAVRILLNLSRFDTDLFEGHGFVRGAGLYGSHVKGSNTEESDVDLWILTEEADDEDLAKLTRELGEAFGGVRPLYLTKAKLGLLREEDPLFYHSLVFGSITIYGEGLEGV